MEAPEEQRLTLKTVTSGFHVVTEPSCLLMLRVRPEVLRLSVLAHGLPSRHVPAAPQPITELMLCLLFPSQEERFAFLTEWYDPSAALLRRYQLLYYPKDGSVEMVRSQPPLCFSFIYLVIFNTPMAGCNFTSTILVMYNMIIFIFNID